MYVAYLGCKRRFNDIGRIRTSMCPVVSEL